MTARAARPRGLACPCGHHGSRFTDNRATQWAAAGFLFTYRDDAGGKADRLVIYRCEFRVDGEGPALFENVTFNGNHAAKWGGAISYHTVAIALLNCTVARNVADEGSDGLFGADGNHPTVNNTLFYDNGTAGSNRHCNREITGAHNMAFPAAPDDSCGASLQHADPLLADDLADHGGFTFTLALGNASPAIDAGSDCPSTDQRGEPRDTDQCDLGAYELQP